VLPEVEALLGPLEAGALKNSVHMPTTACCDLAKELRAGLPDFAFLEADALRSVLMDNIGGCERIASSPLPMAYAIETRRFIFLFLICLPFVLFNQFSKGVAIWAVPLLTVLVAYPFLAIDKIGHELQHPFDLHRLNHLALDRFTSTIERNVLAILEPETSSYETVYNEL
jgi:putative membrane protein